MKVSQNTVSTAITSAILVLCTVGYFISVEIPLPKPENEPVYSPELVSAIGTAVKPSYPRPFAGHLRLWDPNAKITELSPDDIKSSTTGELTTTSNSIIWDGTQILILSGRAQFIPKLLTLHTGSGTTTGIYLSAAYINSFGRKTAVGIRKIVGPQFESFVIPGTSGEIHTLELKYLASDPVHGARPKLAIHSLIFSE